MRDQSVNTLGLKHFQLITLGRIALRNASGEDGDLGKRRRKLALLAVIALSRRPVSRAVLAEMFWGGEDEERARHSLSDALSHLRRVLGKDAIAIRRDIVELEAGVRMAVDATEFDAAVESGDFKHAVSLYGGTFLPDFHVEGSASFDDWAGRMRDRYARLFFRACERLSAELLRDGVWADAHVVALKWLEADGFAVAPMAVLLQAAAGRADSGQSRAALDEYARWSAGRARDLGARGEASIDELASSLAAQLRAHYARLPAIVANGSVDSAVQPPAVETAEGRDPPSAQPRRRFGVGIMAGTAALLGLAVVVFVLGRGARASDAPRKPVIALVDVETAGADSSLQWLQEGLKQMIAADLARVSTADVIPPSVVHAAAERAAWSGAPSAQQSLDLAKALHATLSVSATVARSEESYVVNATLRPLSGGHAALRYTATGIDIAAVADDIAAHILSVAGVETEGPHFSDVETSNTEAFRLFIDGERALQDGRGKDANEKFDAAIAADSGFTSAIVARLHSGDPAVFARVKPLFDRARARLTEWDRLSEAEYEAFHDGDHARAEVLANELATRFPNDPRAINTLAEVYAFHGRFRDAERAYVRLLALDSLAIMGGTGYCSACSAYNGLAAVRHAERDYVGRLQAAKRLVALQPGSPGAWVAYAAALNDVGATDDAIVAGRHSRDLLHSSGFDEFTARALIVARRYDEADAMTARMLGGPADADVRDILATLHRERGQFRAANADLAPLLRGGPGGIDLVVAHALGSLGDLAGAHRLFARTYADPRKLSPTAMSVGGGRGDDARNFAWGHSLEADAIWERADTTLLQALADSVELIGAHSYYARDWQLFHHIRGLVAIRGGRMDEAERELAAGLERYPGWTRTNLLLARVRIERGRPQQAIETLRWAYHEPLDAMGRYATRTELDIEMARAFGAIGQRDSAAVYRGYVTRAWANADPELKQRISSLR